MANDTLLAIIVVSLELVPIADVRSDVLDRMEPILGLSIARGIVEAHNGRLWAMPCSNSVA